ncbi:MAG TPA: LD-carboxypeptidase [Streptosporangiaceae bacterium]|jgi:muramoyltetrapeptide carboxypeptidase|nr:LD-carboxypeptidase [Streptosporangiaceae bacterium]
MQLVKPRALRPGDCIGIVSTSSPVSAGELDRLTAYLTGRGYRVRVADGVLDRDGWLAGSAERRAAGVLSMFGDPEVSLVMPVSGGTGAGHLVDRLDHDLIRANPKVFTSFSDPSALSNSILAAAGLPSVHGVSGFQFFGWPDVDEPTETAFWRMVSGPITGLEVPGGNWRGYRADGLAVSGPVVGGSLWAISSLAGTHWMPSTSGAILLLEAWDATFELVDRMLTQLRLAGVFGDIAALVIGAPADWAHEDAPDASTDELVLRCVQGRFPVITGVEFGHQQTKITFPIGCRVEFDMRGPSPVLRYLEDLVTLDG